MSESVNKPTVTFEDACELAIKIHHYLPKLDSLYIDRYSYRTPEKWVVRVYMEIRKQDGSTNREMLIFDNYDDFVFTMKMDEVIHE